MNAIQKRQSRRAITITLHDWSCDRSFKKNLNLWGRAQDEADFNEQQSLSCSVIVTAPPAAQEHSCDKLTPAVSSHTGISTESK